jgi:hypothetical protein
MLPAMRRLMCLVRGHEMVRYFEPRRMALRCLSCGHQTPGWTIGDAASNRSDASVRRAV